MMNVSIWGIIAALALLAIPMFIIYQFKLKIMNKIMTSIAKMLVYIILTGVFLKYIFEWNDAVINIVWMFLLTLFASFTTITKARLKLKRYIIPVFAGMFVPTFILGFLFLLLVVGIKNPFDARFFIPLTGLMLGNLIVINYKSLSIYYMGLQHHNQLYYYLKGNGATHNEAVNYFVKRALEKASISCAANMASVMVGLSPVVMWVMIFCGSGILAAIEYQLLFFIITFCCSIVSILTTLFVARRYSFDEYDNIKETV